MRLVARAPTVLTRSSPSVGTLIAVRLPHQRLLSTVRFSPPRPLNHYPTNATKYWNNFYKRHQNKFFKDRHYLEKDWGGFFSDDHGGASLNRKIVLEVGCGAGNTIYPLLAAYPSLYIHACDLSPHAIALVKSHAEYREEQINTFVCDVAVDNLSDIVVPASVDIVTLIFMLSAVSPEKMPLVLQNLKKVLKPDGYVLLRDYAIGDFAQVKLEDRNQIISENFCVRRDGTCSFYFSQDALLTLFTQAGFNNVDLNIYGRHIKNRSRNIIMERRWIRAIFSTIDCNKLLSSFTT